CTRGNIAATGIDYW
nr:immunoglobulin heavy chain junction region [Macaca mulatta]MOX64416.1 immunoglobulin heavy chain junction region [Macaca mulatta]MOX68639.1 immunoglobulin heavy chain junction region [Macaca mulatta]